MSAGYPVSKGSLDARLGGLVVQIREALDEVHDFKIWLDQQTDQYLTDLGYVAPADITLIRASYTDLDKLYQIAHAAASQPAPNDFFFNAKKLTGFS